MTNDRRRFLRGAGIALALPMLESGPAVAADRVKPAQVERFVAVGTFLGFHQDSFFPADAGRGYKLGNVLRPLASHRDRLTIFSGLDHRGRNGHEGWKAWMTGNASGSVSVDQLIAAQVGHETRYASLQVTCGTPPSDARLSFTPEGVALPMIGRPSVLYQTLFESGSDRNRLGYLLRTNRSVIDDVLEDARSTQRQVAVKDQQKIDQYLAALRQVEQKLQKRIRWLDRPVPQVEYDLPEFDPIAPDLALECEQIMYDLMALALNTDSTRVITFLIPGWSQVFTIDGQKLHAGYHGLSHHGNDAAKIAEYNLVGAAHVGRFARFLDQLDKVQDKAGRSLLDSTAVVFGSGMGDSNTHDNSNLPTLIAGGPYRHGSHHRIERFASGGRKLGDLYLTLMQSLGVNVPTFANATHNLNEWVL
ncbi:MAG: DUF1552 domain-containing protein [Rubripirellula sp.]|nr:DUF1552 domain-containing protein [Rubripirellula sp.]